MRSELRLWLLLLLATGILDCCYGNVDPKDNSIGGFIHRTHRHRKRNCQEQELDERIRLADVICTGKITDVERDVNQPGVHVATVLVKRVIKLAAILEMTPFSRLQDGQSIKLSGVPDDSHLCDTQFRRHDTWIFLASVRRSAQTTDNSRSKSAAAAAADGAEMILQLNSSLIRMTLPNLNSVNTAVSRFEKLHPNKVLHTAAAQKTTVSQSTVSYEQVEDEVLPKKFDPIRQPPRPAEIPSTTPSTTTTSTTTTTTTTTTPGRDPCESVTCTHGARCVSVDGVSAMCHCPPLSELPCDWTRREPVCATDGKEYKDECDMVETSCREHRDIAKKYDGHCDSCRGKMCDFYAVCQSDNMGSYQCICPDESSCDNDQATSHICGTDGKTYSSECQMKVTSCQQRVHIKKAPAELCDPCFGVTCDGRGEHCQNGRCECQQFCPHEEDPVCGTDAVTYPNECMLDRLACNSKADIAVAYTGNCKDGDEDDGDGDIEFASGDGDLDIQVLPPAENTKRGRNQQPEHSVGGQHKKSDDVANGRSTTDRTGDRRHQGRHQQQQQSSRVRCDDSLCSHGAICEAVGPQRSQRCVCRFNCDAVRSAVCGSDGVVYANECQLKEAACRKQTDITERPFDSCEDVDMEQELCDGRPALVNPRTGLQYDCNDAACPAGSYCHRLPTRTARCCPATGLDESAKGCEGSEFGCCPDGTTVALGRNQAGCPSSCNCNSLGSIGASCDPVTRQCRCKKGVGGLQCDRCEPSFWGMHLIADGAKTGCIPCGCNVFGSLREDCDQMNGRCLCQPGISGLKCNVCPNGEHVGSQGCKGMDIMHNDQPSESNEPVTSKKLTVADSVGICPHRRCLHGSICDSTSGHVPRCVCPDNCDAEEAVVGVEDASKTSSAETGESERHAKRSAGKPSPVCGTDGRTYRSACRLRLHACRHQQRIHVARPGRCTAS